MIRTKSQFDGVPKTKSKNRVCCAQIYVLRVCHTLKTQDLNTAYIYIAQRYIRRVLVLEKICALFSFKAVFFHSTFFLQNDNLRIILLSR